MRCGLFLGLLASVATIACTHLWQLLALRGLTGLAIGAVVATAMAHVGSEAHPPRLGWIMGLYIGGTSAGGALGRLVSGALVGGFSWRWSTAAATLMCAAAIGVFVWKLPPTTGVRVPSVPALLPQPRRRGSCLRAHPTNWRLCFVGFAVMGAYVATFSLLAFRLQRPPFEFPMLAISLLYLLGLSGAVSSPLAGRLADRWGPRRALMASLTLTGAGSAVTIANRPWVVVAGLVVFTAAFFASHAVATGWVSRTAGDFGGRASASYLTAYYLGSAVLAAMSGLIYQQAGWPITALALIALIAAALLAIASAPPS
jgi:YNFM family putative membrane transporter